MLNYELPKEEAVHEDGMKCATMGTPSMYERMIRVPVNDAILEALELGDKIDLKLCGVVCELRKTDNEHEQNRTLELKITAVEVEPEKHDEDDGDNKMKEMEDAAASIVKGFKKATKGY